MDHLDEQLLPLDNAGSEELLESLPDDVLVVVVVGAVYQPVARLHRRDHRSLVLALVSFCLSAGNCLKDLCLPNCLSVKIWQ